LLDLADNQKQTHDSLAAKPPPIITSHNTSSTSIKPLLLSQANVAAANKYNTLKASNFNFNAHNLSNSSFAAQNNNNAYPNYNYNNNINSQQDQYLRKSKTKVDLLNYSNPYSDNYNTKPPASSNSNYSNFPYVANASIGSYSKTSLANNNNNNTNNTNNNQAVYNYIPASNKSTLFHTNPPIFTDNYTSSTYSSYPYGNYSSSNANKNIAANYNLTLPRKTGYKYLNTKASNSTFNNAAPFVTSTNRRNTTSSANNNSASNHQRSASNHSSSAKSNSSGASSSAAVVVTAADLHPTPYSSLNATTNNYNTKYTNRSTMTDSTNPTNSNNNLLGAGANSTSASANGNNLVSFRDPREAPLRKLSVDLIKTYKHINEVIKVLTILMQKNQL
jgi:hypothetical protein